MNHQVWRFVPPEYVYHEIHGRIRKRHDFEMGNWKVFDGACYTLHYEPRGLEKDKGLSEPVAPPPSLVSASVGMKNDSE